MTCAIESCTKAVPVQLLMCPKHWRQVPSEVQVRVYRTWRARQRDPENAEKVTAHREACAAAVAAVVGVSHG